MPALVAGGTEKDWGLDIPKTVWDCKSQLRILIFYA